MVNPQSLPGPAEVEAILAEVTKIRPELAAFFGCLYYAALRPAEAVALRAHSCDLPQIEQALRPSIRPAAGPQESAWAPGILSVMRPCHSWAAGWHR